MNASHTPQETYTQEEGRRSEVRVPHSTLGARPHAFNWGLGIWAGLVATLVVTLMMYWVPPLLGMPPIDVGMMMGTMLIPQPGPTAFWLGMVVHFINGVVFTLVYAGVLLALHKQSTAGTGLWLGGIVWLLGPMLLVPLVMEMHPLVRAGEMQNPGFFMLNMGMGWTPAIFDLVAHLVYGVIAGVLYKHKGQVFEDATGYKREAKVIH